MYTFDTLPKEKQTELINYVLDNIDNYDEPEASELHYHLFNDDYYIIGHYNAKQWMKSLDVFEVIETVHEYEELHFGELFTKINPEAIVNMFVYIMGMELLNMSETLDEKWDEELTESDIEKIKEELLQWNM